MRKYLLFILFLCMHCIARGQTGYDYRYWFDNDDSQMREDHSMSDSWQFQADLSGLSESFHAIHIQVADTAGVLSAPMTRFFIKMRDTDVKEGRYWFDNDIKTQRTNTAVQGIFDIDVSGLQEGFHTFHYQVVGIDGSYSSVTTRSFYRVLVPESSYYRCWVDEDYTTMTKGRFTGTPILVDITSISEGYHVLRVQLDGSTPSSPVSHSFVKIPQTEGVEYLTCLCSVDDKLFRQEQVPSEGGIINWNFDVSDLSQGFHRMQVQVVTPSGAATSTYDAFFLRTTTNEEMGEMKCVYCIDGAEFYTEAGRMSNGAFHCDLDVSALTDGLHRLSYYLTNGKGVSTKMTTQFFMKTPVGGNGIMQYEYWQNDQGDDAHKKVKLSQRTNPYNLISLLPVETLPIRSCNFKFAVKDGMPLIYAHNEIHLRFTDSQGRFVDESKEYVDEQVSATVEPVGELQPTQTFPKVTGNDIRWYTLQVAPGDTAAFRVSQAATVQVFAPSGKEVFKTSESASVKWAGIHTWEDGTYYVAVHDVTGSQNTMTLDYMHMDKYDVVDWDVHTVGNGGCSTITFKGNGFRDLYAVDLFTEEGDTIHSEHIDYESDASITVRFNFTDANVGEYDALFHFTEGEKEIRTCVNVEEAENIILVENVVYASNFLRGTANTYTIKIENKGNSTAYQVPLKIQLQADGGINDITYIKLSENLSSLEFEWLDDEAIPESDKEALKALIASKGNYLDFLMVRDTIENEEFMEGYFAVNLPPKTTTSFTVTVKSNSRVNVYTLLPNDWDFFAFGSQPSKLPRRIMRKSAKESMCCAKQHVECAMNLVATILDYGSVMGGGWAVASCIASVGNTVIPFAYDIWCGETPKDKDEAMKSLYKNIASSLISCVSKLDPYKMGWMIQHVNDVISTSISCFSHPKRIPNCPPKPPIPHPSNPQPPSDPNDIYGYLSEAGSKFIADSVAKVNYTIEFENDTAFAEASAHSIVIKDTLDSRYFDMRSFLPTSIKLGEREAFLDEVDIKTENGVTTFLKTIDMRPEINAIAQVEGEYSQQTGIATWTFTSLDPMTMEPTDDLMQGILPVNYNGTSGIGEVMFEVGVKPNKGDGAKIPNRASIVFDYEDPIITPTWTNTVDAIAPTSTILGGIQKDNETLMLRIAGEDNRSGVWRYNVYAQAGQGASWELVAENVPVDTMVNATETLVDVHIFEGIEYGFLVLATDSAGNVEHKSFEEADFRLSTVKLGDANGDGTVDALDVVLATSYYLGNDVFLNFAAADVVADGEINSLDVVAIQNIYLNTSSSVKARIPRRRHRKLKP